LLDAWSRLRERGVLTDGARLIVIGDGVQRNALEQRTETLGIRQSVTFTGALPQAVVAQWIAASDMLCLPSHHEGTPNVVVEALAAGVPVVASRVGGIPALVRDGENGALIAPGEVEALADAIEQTWMRKWDRAAIRASVEHLTWAALATENLAMFAEVVKRRVL
jgi:glycosyltransferase involved in cell wall biosynthesis